MCDSEHEGREWYFYIQDMLEFGERALSYTDLDLDHAINPSFRRKPESSPRSLDSGLRRSDNAGTKVAFLYGRVAH